MLNNVEVSFRDTALETAFNKAVATDLFTVKATDPQAFTGQDIDVESMKAFAAGMLLGTYALVKDAAPQEEFLTSPEIVPVSNKPLETVFIASKRVIAELVAKAPNPIEIEIIDRPLATEIAKNRPVLEVVTQFMEHTL